MTIYRQHNHSFDVEIEEYRKSENQDPCKSYHLYYTGIGLYGSGQVERSYCGDHGSMAEVRDYIRNAGIGAKL